jgi:hypothetical protein
MTVSRIDHWLALMNEAAARDDAATVAKLARQIKARVEREEHERQQQWERERDWRWEYGVDDDDDDASDVHLVRRGDDPFDD